MVGLWSEQGIEPNLNEGQRCRYIRRPPLTSTHYHQQQQQHTRYTQATKSAPISIENAFPHPSHILSHHLPRSSRSYHTIHHNRDGFLSLHRPFPTPQPRHSRRLGQHLQELDLRRAGLRLCGMVVPLLDAGFSSFADVGVVCAIVWDQWEVQGQLVWVG